MLYESSTSINLAERAGGLVETQSPQNGIVVGFFSFRPFNLSNSTNFYLLHLRLLKSDADSSLDEGSFRHN